jgi:hypothetical protein
MIIFLNKNTQKPNYRKCDGYDVTIGSPAIFQKQDTSKEVQRGILRPVAFRPHLTMNLALYRKRFALPTGKPYLLGAGHLQFEVVLHGLTP